MEQLEKLLSEFYQEMDDAQKAEYANTQQHIQAERDIIEDYCQRIGQIFG